MLQLFRSNTSSRSGHALALGALVLAFIVICLNVRSIDAALLTETGDDQDAESLELFELPQVRWVTAVVGRGDSLSSIMQRNGFKASLTLRLVRVPGGERLHKIKPGDEFRIAYTGANVILGIEYLTKGTPELMFLFDNDNIQLLDRKTTKDVGTLGMILARRYQAERPKDEHFVLPDTDESLLTWTSVDVRRGQTLTHIFRRLRLPTSTAIKLARQPEGKWLRKLQIGQQLDIATTPDGKFFTLESSKEETIKKVVMDDQGQVFFLDEAQVLEYQRHHGCGTVESSLLESGLDQGMPARALHVFVDLFSFRVDFAREMRTGDEFCLIYKQGYLKGKPIHAPVILAASFKQENRMIHAFRFVDDYLRPFYYDQNGDSLSGMFLRSPLKSSTVSSGFSDNRFHPIRKKFLPHRGVDYKANYGTPIFATAAGSIIKSGWNGGYGRAVVIQHGSKYRTLYAHMSKIAPKARVGHYVNQGDVIGYVGSSGLSTGPHVHYEFLVNGKHKDPLSYDMPSHQSISEFAKGHFEKFKNAWIVRLESINDVMVAYQPVKVKAQPNVENTSRTY